MAKPFPLPAIQQDPPRKAAAQSPIATTSADSASKQFAILRELLRSPFYQDTIKPLFGSDPHVQMTANRMGYQTRPGYAREVLGEANIGTIAEGGEDTVSIYGGAFGDDKRLRQTMMHETAHTGWPERSFRRSDVARSRLSEEQYKDLAKIKVRALNNSKYSSAEDLAYTFGAAQKWLDGGFSPYASIDALEKHWPGVKAAVAYIKKWSSPQERY